MVAETPGRGSFRFSESPIEFGIENWWSKIGLSVGIAAALALIGVCAALSCFGIARTTRERMAGDSELASTTPARLHSRIVHHEHGPVQLNTRPARKLGAGLRLAGLNTTDTDRPAAEPPNPSVRASDAPPQAEPEGRGVAEIAREVIGQFRRLLGSTGLDVERLFPQFSQTRAQGGPFVAPPNGNRPPEVGPDQLEAMRSLLKSLPLAAPLDQYQVESPFGPRRDPFNHRASFHTGIDLSAPYMSPVYATAEGVVTYAGYRSDYGKVVEIDHGNGIATVYGHLHRYIVTIGQRVGEHDQIGFLGSTGRSSGPHVHYEVRVNDEPQDPEKFVGLARVIPASHR